MTASTALRATVLLVLAGLTLTACGGGTGSAAEPTKTQKTFASKSSPSPTPTTSPSPVSTRKFQADGGYYVDVYDLQHEVVAAGGTVCEDFEYWGFVAYADGGISCSNRMVMLDVFESPEALALYKATEIKSGNASTYDMDHSWLQGKNWLVRGEDKWYPLLQKKMGGEIITYSTGPSHRP